MGTTLGKGMRKPVQAVGAVFAVIGLTLLLLAITTSHWVTIDINRDATPALSGGGLSSYSRDRGIYKECWKDSEVENLITSSTYRYGKSAVCLNLDLEVWDTSRDTELTSDYKTWQGLQVGMWAMFGVCGLFIFLALVLYCYTLCQHINNYEWKSGCKASAGLMLGSIFFNVLAMALFHGAENLERNTVTDSGLELQAPYPSFFETDHSQDLINRTLRVYGWSYALSWCAVACELLAAVLFMVVSCCYVKSTNKSKTLVYSKSKQSTVVVGQRNPAYDVVHEKVVVAPPKVYVVEDDYYQHGRGTFDPYSHGQPQNGYSTRYSYDKGWMVE